MGCGAASCLSTPAVNECGDGEVARLSHADLGAASVSPIHWESRASRSAPWGCIVGKGGANQANVTPAGVPGRWGSRVFSKQVNQDTRMPNVSIPHAPMPNRHPPPTREPFPVCQAGLPRHTLPVRRRPCRCRCWALVTACRRGGWRGLLRAAGRARAWVSLHHMQLRIRPTWYASSWVLASSLVP